MAISPQPLSLSFAAKHRTPALVKRCFGIAAGKSNYSLTLMFGACVPANGVYSVCTYVCVLVCEHTLYRARTPHTLSFVSTKSYVQRLNAAYCIFLDQSGHFLLCFGCFRKVQCWTVSFSSRKLVCADVCLVPPGVWGMTGLAWSLSHSERLGLPPLSGGGVWRRKVDVLHFTYKAEETHAFILHFNFQLLLFFLLLFQFFSFLWVLHVESCSEPLSH